jgi:GT2 family glycosyltransferase
MTIKPAKPKMDCMEIPKQRCVDVVVVNWNGGRLVTDCVGSLDAFGERVNRIIVVDNGSTDGSISMLPRSKRIHIIENGENLGFARACNLGAERGNSDYILFFNPDARLIDTSLTKLIEFMSSPAADRIGICGAKLIGDDGQTQRSCANFTDVSTYLGGAIGLTERFPRLFTPLFATFDYTKSRIVDQPIGAYFLIRRTLFEQLDGFDERFFVYFEEVDLALRAKNAGWDAYYFSDAVAFHKGGGSSERVRARRLFYSLRSRLQYAAKHFSLIGFAAVGLASLIVEPLGRLARAGVRLSGAEVADTLGAYGMLWKDMPRIVHKIRK